ncbi:MAG: HipA family kinase [Balneolaceae bacterium]
MINTVYSIQLVSQKKTYNHPVEAICRSESGLDVYFIKYNRAASEIDGLIAEIVCHFLAKQLHLETPDIAYVKIGNHPIPENFQYANYLTQEKFAFGSKKVRTTEDELTQLEFIFSKHEFNRIEFPEHLLRIGLFDLWTGNNDRTAQNYNLFLTRGKTQKLVVFDHFEAFNKIAEHSFENITTEIDVYSDGFLSTNYAYEMLGWVSKENLKNELDNFFSTIENIDLEEMLQSIAETYPPGWDNDLKTADYINRFLSSERRLEEIRNQVTNYINYLHQKT